MFFKDDGKKHASIVIRRIKGSDSHEYNDVEEEQEDHLSQDSGYDHAVSAMMSAFERKDKDEFKSALKSFIKMCLHEKESNSEDRDKY
jgi:hypothetical protein